MSYATEASFWLLAGSMGGLVLGEILGHLRRSRAAKRR